MPLLDVRVHGLPIAQGRPRAFKTPQGHVHVYDPATSRDWKRTVVAQVLERKPATPAEGPLAMELVFYFPRPKSLPKRIRHHTTRPDADNCAKAIKDALRGVIYRDDAQVVRLTISKAYDPSPGVAIRVEPMVVAHGDGEVG